VQYDVWKGHHGLAKRSVFVVDRDQIVRYRWVTDDALVLPDFDAVVDTLRTR
jgi:glutaredoxin-dependent peroxiredoxin